MTRQLTSVLQRWIALIGLLVIWQVGAGLANTV